jgi:hypothetical protein
MFLKLLNRNEGWLLAPGYASESSDPYSAVEVPPKSFVVPGMFAPPSCQAQCPPTDVVE